jgi:uncharacterized protein (TIGR02246 family)
MKTIYGTALILLEMLAVACAQKVNDPADVQAIKTSLDDYAKAFNAGDAGKATALMADNAIYADNHFPVANGMEAIRSPHRAFFDQFKADFSCPVENVRVVGNLAVARGTWTAKMTPKAQGIAPASDGGSWTVTSVRQSDGSWKWDWCEPNSSQPMPGTTASGQDEQALYQIERDMAEALVKKDAAAWDRMLGNEFQANYASVVANKKQFLAAIKSDTTRFESVTGSGMKAFVFGDTAVVHGLSISKSSMGGKDTSGQERFTEVFVKRDGRWQCVTGYSARVN